jgi:hypothetical protein
VAGLSASFVQADIQAQSRSTCDQNAIGALDLCRLDRTLSFQQAVKFLPKQRDIQARVALHQFEREAQIAERRIQCVCNTPSDVIDTLAMPLPQGSFRIPPHKDRLCDAVDAHEEQHTGANPQQIPSKQRPRLRCSIAPFRWGDLNLSR